MNRSPIITSVLVLLLAGPAILWADPRQPVTERMDLVIPAMPVGSALNEFGRQTGLHIVMDAEVTRNLQSKSVEGSFSVEGALKRLLAETGLRYEYLDPQTIAIRREPPGTKRSLPPHDSNSVTSREGADIQLSRIEADRAAAAQDGREGAAAHEEMSSAGAQAEGSGEVVVTGSRISRPASQVAAQVIVLDSQALQSTGEVTLERALRQLPQNIFSTSGFGPAIGSSFNGAVNVTAGATVNLRGLGSESTLVLVDGRRIGQSGLFGGAADISGIPLDAVERVEIVLDGASSIYGSDAVGGVVNIILKKDYDGMQAAYRIGLPGKSGFEEHIASLSGGDGWEGGRFRATYEIFRSTNLDGTERPSSAFALYSSPANFSASVVPLFYRFDGQNFLLSELSGLGLMPDSPGVQAIFRTQAPAGQDGTALTVADFSVLDTVLANNDTGRSLIPEQSRHTLQGGFGQALNLFGSEIVARGDFHYSTKTVRAGVGAATLQAEVPASNAFNPFEGSNTFMFLLLPDLPRPYFDTDQELLRGNLGFQGQTGRWQWTVDAGRSREEIETVRYNSAISRFQIPALLAQGLNVFAADVVVANNPALVDQLQQEPQPATSINTQSVIGFAVDGPLFSLPGGDARLAVGGEWSETKLDTQSGASIGEPGLGGVSIPIDPYERVVVETSRESAFVELLMPLVDAGNARPAVQQFILTGSARYDGYDNYGDSTTWSAGAVWSPVRTLRLKANRSTSFVVPTPREGLVPTEMVDFVDLIGFPLPIFIVDENGFPTGESDLEAGIISGGNPELQPETADSLSFRVEYTPQAIPGLQFGVSWHETSYDNRIGPTPISLFGLYPPDLENFPDLIYRNEDGYIVRDFRATNITAVETSGIDYDARYDLSTRFGRIGVRANIAYTHKWRQIAAPGSEPLDLVAEAEQFANNVVPRYRYSANLNWTRGGLYASLDLSTSSDTAMRYTAGDLLFTAAGVPIEIGTPLRRTYRLPVLTDLSVSYDLSQDGRGVRPGWLASTTLSLHIVNVLDEQPRLTKAVVATGAGVFEDVDTDYNANIADPRGRMFYLGLKKNF
jgi:outer membrane receptor protein involved in Fe transport